jgi:LysM repeat protein
LTTNIRSCIIEHVFPSRFLLPGAVALVTLLAALGVARSASGTAPEARHVVQEGETLWEIAANRYDGDLRKAVWEIERRNDLRSAVLHPGEVLMLP